MFHGHYGFVLLSKYPIKTDEIQSWQTLLWQQMPNSLLPTQYYSPQAQAVLPLSSKNHVCVPIEYDEQIINILCCHPTPPVFDGEERRNAKRNHDELRLLVDIIDGTDYLVSDQGQTSGINLQQPFVVMGDLNADPIDGDGIKAGIDALLNHPLIEKSVATDAKVPASLGGNTNGSTKSVMASQIFGLTYRGYDSIMFYLLLIVIYKTVAFFGLIKKIQSECG